MQLHISNDRPAPSSLPTGVQWCPSVGRMANGSTDDWPANPDYDWASRLCFQVPLNHSGLLMIDYEGQRVADLYSGNGPVREKAIDELRKQVNVVRQVRPNALVGLYAGPQSPHQWPTDEYIDDAYSFGRQGELLNRQKVIFPLCYLVSPNVGESHHYRMLMRMAMAAREEYGMRVAPVLSPRDWHGGDIGSFNAWDSFEEVVATVASFGPTDMVLWEAEYYFLWSQKASQLGRALTAAELSICAEIAEANNMKAIEILRRYAV